MVGEGAQPGIPLLPEGQKQPLGHCAVRGLAQQEGVGAGGVGGVVVGEGAQSSAHCSGSSRAQSLQHQAQVLGVGEDTKGLRGGGVGGAGRVVRT